MLQEKRKCHRNIKYKVQTSYTYHEMDCNAANYIRMPWIGEESSYFMRACYSVGKT